MENFSGYSRSYLKMKSHQYKKETSRNWTSFIASCQPSSPAPPRQIKDPGPKANAQIQNYILDPMCFQSNTDKANLPYLKMICFFVAFWIPQKTSSEWNLRIRTEMEHFLSIIDAKGEPPYLLLKGRSQCHAMYASVLPTLRSYDL